MYIYYFYRFFCAALCFCIALYIYILHYKDIYGGSGTVKPKAPLCKGSLLFIYILFCIKTVLLPSCRVCVCIVPYFKIVSVITDYMVVK